jgi:hypothetical protein
LTEGPRTVIASRTWSPAASADYSARVISNAN